MPPVKLGAMPPFPINLHYNQPLAGCERGCYRTDLRGPPHHSPELETVEVAGYARLESYLVQRLGWMSTTPLRAAPSL